MSKDDARNFLKRLLPNRMVWLAIVALSFGAFVLLHTIVNSISPTDLVANTGIANHTLHHWYKKMSPLVAQREIEDTAKIIKEVLHVETAYFRPPGGILTNGLVAYAQKHHQSVNMWSVDTGDSHPKRPTPEAMVETVLAQATPGGIVLMHDGGGNHGNTVKAVPQIIAKLRAKGYKFVTIPELLTISSTLTEPPIAHSLPKVKSY